LTQIAGAAPGLGEACVEQNEYAVVSGHRPANQRERAARGARRGRRIIESPCVRELLVTREHLVLLR
jgi:hypothetical protein